MLRLPRAIRTLPTPMKLGGGLALGAVAYHAAGAARVAAGTGAAVLLGSAAADAGLLGDGAIAAALGHGVARANPRPLKRAPAASVQSYGFGYNREQAARVDEIVSRLPVDALHSQLPEEHVRPDAVLWATQQTLGPETLAHFARGGRFVAGPRDKHVEPLVVRLRGRSYIWNGHHRIAAARLRGVPIWVRVLDLDVEGLVPRHNPRALAGQGALFPEAFGDPRQGLLLAGERARRTAALEARAARAPESAATVLVLTAPPTAPARRAAAPAQPVLALAGGGARQTTAEARALAAREHRERHQVPLRAR